MKDHHPLFIVLIFLVFASSFNRGEKINDWIRKFNERRAAGILAQPRVGRTIGIGSFGRSEGGSIAAAAAAGLVHYPRVGRSRADNDDRRYQLQSNEQMKNSFEEGKLQKHLNDNGIWTSMPASEIIKEQHRYSFYDDQIDDLPKMEGQLLLYHLPKELDNRIR